MGFYMQNITPYRTCLPTCPAGQYIPSLLGDDLWVCYLCDTTKCQ